MKKILILHALHKQLRKTNVDFVASFARHMSGVEVHYMNVMGVAASKALLTHYDVMIVTTEVLGLRSAPSWQDVAQRISRIAATADKVVLCPQDDYTYSSRLDNLASDISADYVWTPIQNDFELLYPKSRRKGSKFRTILTGYSEDFELYKYKKYSKAFDLRTVDLGQRVRSLPPEFGAAGRQKSVIAEKFANLARAQGLRVDVSTKPEDVLLGDDWLRFLGNTRFTISRKGGASLADTYNKFGLRNKQLAALPGKLGDLLNSFLPPPNGVIAGDFSAESPRLFEAAALGVCQILEEDDYLGGEMRPWVHYVPLKSDFSNTNEIFNFTSNKNAVEKMIADAKSLLVNSGLFSYESFVSESKKMLGLETSSESTKVIDKDEEPANQLEGFSGIGRAFTALTVCEMFKILNQKSFKTAWRKVNEFETLPEIFMHPWISYSDSIKLSLGEGKKCAE